MALAALFGATVHVSQGQQPGIVPRIGYVAPAAKNLQAPRIKAFRQGLLDLGYIEGKNIVIEYRFAEGKADRIPELIAELVAHKVDIFVVQNSLIARAAKKVTSTIPIVMLNAGNPFADGLIASLARPGGNVTGMTNFATDLGVKRLELLKEMLPKLARVGVLSTMGRPGQERGVLQEMQEAAPLLKLQLHVMEVRAADDFERAFDAATKARVEAFAPARDSTGLFEPNRKRILELVVKKRLPAAYPESAWAEDGGLMSYSADELDNYRRGAIFVDKILKGRKPSDLPVEQPMKFEFVVNLIAAKQIGFTVPPNVLVRATKVIR